MPNRNLPDYAENIGQRLTAMEAIWLPNAPTPLAENRGMPAYAQRLESRVIALEAAAIPSAASASVATSNIPDYLNRLVPRVVALEAVSASPAVVVSAVALGSNAVQVTFNHSVDASGWSAADFEINDAGSFVPAGILHQDDAIHITVSKVGGTWGGASSHWRIQAGFAGATVPSNGIVT
jgi:hypothetical protein